MSMLNDRERHLLKDLERQLEQEDSAWVHQFKDLKARRPARRNLALETTIGPLMLFAALCLVLGAIVPAVIFGTAAIVAYIYYRL